MNRTGSKKLFISQFCLQGENSLQEFHTSGLSMHSKEPCFHTLAPTQYNGTTLLLLYMSSTNLNSFWKLFILMEIKQ